MNTIKFKSIKILLLAFVISISSIPMLNQSAYAEISKTEFTNKYIEDTVISVMKHIDLNQKYTQKTSFDTDLKEMIESKRDVYNYIKAQEDDYTLENYNISVNVEASKTVNHYLIKTCYASKSYNYSDALDHDTEENTVIYVVVDTNTNKIV